MKIYDDYETGNTLIVGCAEEIRAVYKTMRKAYEADRISVGYTHYDFPVFTAGEIYGIEIIPAELRFWVRGSSAVCKLLNVC